MPEKSDIPEPALLDLRNIRVMRGQNLVLDNLNLRIGANEHVAILGPNGCGKSTLIKTITRECYPVQREGSAMTILGHQRWNVFELRPLLGIISNDLLAWCSGEATAREVVLSGFFSGNSLYPNHIVEPKHKRAAEAALDQVGAFGLAERPVCELSSGEAKRVLIARALAHQPRALLFDEPSNSLDIAARHSLREMMSSLANSGIGIILVTHDLSDIVPEIERVLLMRGGKIVADGSKDQILQPKPMSELFGVEVGIERKAGVYHMH